MKMKLKTNCSIVRIVRLFDCGRVVRSAIAVALCAVGLSAFADEPADTVVYGTIRTAEAEDYVAGAIAIKDGKYVYVGDEVGVEKYILDGVTEVIDHRGKGMVMPGCTDGHSHYVQKFCIANMKGGVLFAGDDDKAAVLQKLGAAALKAKEAGKQSLLGFGWNYHKIIPAGGPTLKELDDATHGVSTVIFDSSGHSAYCNSECLRRCKIIDGEGGVLIDKIDGGLLKLDENEYPTGYVDERVTGYLTRMGGIDANEIVDDELAETSIRLSQELLLSTGYTIAFEGWSNVLHPTKFYVAANGMDNNGELKIVFPMTYEVEPWQTNIEDIEVGHLAALKEVFGTKHVLPEYLKVFMDGCAETKTGAMSNPYKDGTVYKSFWSVDRLAGITKACNERGLVVHTHVMGDVAITEATDAYIKANTERGNSDCRNCLVHLRNVNTNDFQRFADNNISCTAGLTWHLGGAEKELGEIMDEDYVNHSYPIKSFFDVGAKVSSHSDFPANGECPQDPFGMMHVAVTGQHPNHPELKPYDTNELVTVEQAFQTLTINGAWQLGLENERGSIKVGKYADFVLADQDVFACEKTEIGKTKVVSTWFEGEMVYPLRGSEENPWVVGGDASQPENVVEAYTNGTELVIQGEGAVTNLAAISSAVKGGLTALTIKAGVAGALPGVFAGFVGVALTLPDGWQGELPKDGAWYGATGVTMEKWPLAVKNVKSQQRYPWNGLVDVTCDLTGSGEVKLSATALTNGIEFIEAKALTGETTVDLGEGGVTNGVKLIWNAAKDLPTGFKGQGIKVKVTVEQ